MSVTAGQMTTRARPARSVEFREHRIPSANSAPYICVEGPDGNLWFCESGAAKIGCFDPRSATFTEFSLPTPGATPIGIALGGDGNLWFAQKKANKIGRMSPGGALAEFAVPTANAGPDAIGLGPDGNIWFSETDVSQIGRITPDGKITEFKTGISPGSKPLSIVVRDGALWFSEAAGNRVAPHHRRRRRHRIRHSRHTTRSRAPWSPIPTATSGLSKPAPMRSAASAATTHSANSCSRRRTRRLRGVTVGPDGNLWCTENFANKIGHMAPDGTLIGEYDIPTPASGARCIAAHVERPALFHAIRCRLDRGNHPRLNRHVGGSGDGRTHQLSGGQCRVQRRAGL